MPQHFQINFLFRGLHVSVSLLGKNLRVCVIKVLNLNLSCDFTDEETREKSIK